MEKDDFRCGFVTIVGRSNVGKSTLMNHMVGMKIAITSAKPQTTRKRIKTVYTDERGQIIFVDTPGIHTAKNRLSDYMDKAAIGALTDVDLVVWVVEPSTYIGPADREIAGLIKESGSKVILAINKIDSVKKEELLPVMDCFSKLIDAVACVPVSALKSMGTDELKKEIIDNLPLSPPLYDDETVTEETVRNLSGEIIREKILRCLKDEVPHGVAVEIEQMKEEERITRIDAVIVCEKDSHKGIIIGKGGTMLKRIGTLARKDIEDLLEAHVSLKLFVKVRKDWRDNESLMKSYGYDPKDL